MKVEQHEWDKVTTWVVPFAARHECYRFDESLITFGCMVGTGSEKAIDAPPKSKIDFVHSWHVNIRRWEVIPSSSFVPEELVESIARGFADSDGQIDPKLPIDAKFEARPSFVAAFLKATMLPDGHATLETIESRPSGEPFLLRLGDLSFRFRTKGGGSIGHDLLSYGQKRLLSFLYYVACNDTFIVADELVNGLHHAWIEVCLDAIGERQAFLTSQNPILLDFVPPTSPEQAERRFIRCVLEEREGRDVMVWRNLTPDEATELCKQYAVGIQQLSELLRVNGLW